MLLCAFLVYPGKAMQGPAGPPQTAAPRARRAKRVTSRSANVAVVPATVILEDGKLQVDAHNSDLGQILKNVAEASGMTIEGAVGTARIFGVYGPHNPRDVLAELLVGAGYDFIMVGATADGAPRQLLLTQRSNPPLSEDHATPVAQTTVLRNVETVHPAAEQPQTVPVEDRPPGESQDPQERLQKRMQRLQDMLEPPKASPPQ